MANIQGEKNKIKSGRMLCKIIMNKKTLPKSDRYRPGYSRLMDNIVNN